MNKCIVLRKYCNFKTFAYQAKRHLTHYEALGLKSDATPQEIKLAYKEKSLQLHPDVNKDDPTTHDRFIRVKEAYHVLSKERTRDDYDKELEISDIYRMHSTRFEAVEERYDRLHRNFQNHFGVKMDREEFVKQYKEYEEEGRQSNETTNIVHGWIPYIVASSIACFLIMVAILTNENKKKYREVHGLNKDRYRDMHKKKRMFMEHLDHQEEEEMALFYMQMRAHKRQHRKEDIEYERRKYNEVYRKQHEKSNKKKDKYDQEKKS